jgi:O-succinylbenzoic acid--CoA ligase
LFNLSKGSPILNPKLSLLESEELKSLALQFPQKDGVWIASSGSTRKARNSVKLVALSKGALQASARSVNLHLCATARDVWAQVLPAFHVGGLGIETRARLSGAIVVPALRDGKWDADYFCKLSEEKNVTLASVVPTQVYDLLQLKIKPPSRLRVLLVGGGALSEELYFSARALGWPLLPSYGMTEACSTVAVAKISTLETVPTKYPAFEVLSHLEVRSNSENQLQIRGESLLTGYAFWTFENHQKTSHWIDPKDREGWYQTEDICELNHNGLKILGRETEFYKILGEGVSLPKLEALLQQILVKRQISPLLATIVAQPHLRDGWELQLIFAERMGLESAQGVFAEFNGQVLGYERLRSLRGVTEIPRTDLGKVNKSLLIT